MLEQAERRRIYSQENVVAAEEAKKGMMRIEGRDSDARGSLACCSAQGRRVRHDSAMEQQQDARDGGGGKESWLETQSGTESGGVLSLPSGGLARPTLLLFFFPLPVMLPFEIPKLPTDPLVRGFPGVWKLLLLHDSLPGMALHP